MNGEGLVEVAAGGRVERHEREVPTVVALGDRVDGRRGRGFHLGREGEGHLELGADAAETLCQRFGRRQAHHARDRRGRRP